MSDIDPKSDQMEAQQGLKMIEKKWYNFFADNGLPVPLVRHHGRGDLVATIAVMFAVVVAALLMFGGSSYVGPSGGTLAGIKIVVPGLKDFTSAAVALVSVLGALVGYVTKRRDDLKNGNGHG